MAQKVDEKLVMVICHWLDNLDDMKPTSDEAGILQERIESFCKVLNESEKLQIEAKAKTLNSRDLQFWIEKTLQIATQLAVPVAGLLMKDQLIKTCLKYEYGDAGVLGSSTTTRNVFGSLMKI